MPAVSQYYLEVIWEGCCLGLLCPDTDLWWHRHVCLHAGYVSVTLHGGMALPVHVSAVSQHCYIWIHGFTHLLCSSVTTKQPALCPRATPWQCIPSTYLYAYNVPVLSAPAHLFALVPCLVSCTTWDLNHVSLHSCHVPVVALACVFSCLLCPRTAIWRAGRCGSSCSHGLLADLVQWEREAGKAGEGQRGTCE